MERALLNPLELASPARSRRFPAGVSPTRSHRADGHGDDRCVGRARRRRRHRVAPAADLGHPPRGRRVPLAARSARPAVRAVERHELRASRRPLGRGRLRRAGRRPPAPSTWGRCDARRPRRAAASRRSPRRLAGALAGCSNDPLAEQYRAGDSKGYIAGDASDRRDRGGRPREPVVFDGHDRDGRHGRERRLSPATCSS